MLQLGNCVRDLTSGHRNLKVISFSPEHFNMKIAFELIDRFCAHSVWPDGEIKSSPIFPKVAVTVTTAVLIEMLLFFNRVQKATYFLRKFVYKNLLGSRHSSMVSSAPTILWLWVWIPSTLSMFFSICIIEIVMRKGQNKQKELGCAHF